MQVCDKTSCPNKMAKIISDPADFIPVDLMHKRSCLFYNNNLLNKDFLHQIFSGVASIFFLSICARLH